jgi:hypothetical protein
MAQTAPPPSGLEALRRLFRTTFFRAADSTGTRFQDSFGVQLSDLGGRSRWGLVGTASQVWHDTILTLTDDLVRQNEGEIYRNWKIRDTTSIRHCWMVGSDREHAYPTIVICCTARPILKRTMKMLLEEETIKREGFKVLGARTQDVRLMATSSSPPHAMHPLDIALSEPRSICGTRIVADETGKGATIGGAIIVDGIYYGLTVAHLFAKDDEASSEIAVPDELEIYDGDWAFQTDDAADDNDEDNEDDNEDEKDDDDDEGDDEDDIGELTYPGFRYW